jgi:phosphoenolpyruvate-protein kinase (PTS system EI component)
MTTWVGSGVAPGAAAGRSWRADKPVGAGAAAGPDEVVRAFRAVAADLDRLAERTRAQGRAAAADIVAVGALIASDPELVEAARRAGAAAAVEGYAATLAALPDPTLRERATDVRQVGRRVLRRLAGLDSGPPAGRFVLVAAEIGPADLLEHLGSGLVGAVAVRGGANSHAAIVARSVGLPLLAGVDPAVLDLPDKTSLLIDADAGVVVVDPPAAVIAQTAVQEEKRRALFAAERSRAHVTLDGQPFALLCNVASDVEVRLGRESGAEGIGLLRTELPFLSADRWPTEEEHRRALRPVLAEAAGWPVTVRLLDFSGDKVPPFLRDRPRSLLDEPDALAAQLRAIWDVPGLRILVPMVRAPGELRQVRALAPPGIPVGAMVETVAAVEETARLGTVADFLSIGTNDLTAQALGLDRRDPRSGPALTGHPRVLELVGRVVAGASRPLTVCGDAGAHPTTLPLLLGAGVRGFSVACARVDETRYRLRRLDTARCREVFAAALRLRDADETAALVREALP